MASQLNRGAAAVDLPVAEFIASGDGPVDDSLENQILGDTLVLREGKFRVENGDQLGVVVVKAEQVEVVLLDLRDQKVAQGIVLAWAVDLFLDHLVGDNLGEMERRRLILALE